jgi:transposase
MNVFAARTAELAEARPELAAAVEPLLKAREAVARQIADLDRKVMRLASNDAQDAQVSLHVRSLSPRGHACNLTTLEFE